ncbi:type-4 uracil-DNA glycosylase [Clostridiales bacterium]|nr:type-4 uracil-DNA glycosylase [Clostridiales bacterium]
MAAWEEKALAMVEDLNKRIASATAIKFPEKRVIFGEGNAEAKIMLIGEAPGGDEEAQGRPFVGKAGKNLMEFLTSLSLCRHELYITNVVKIRPCCISSKTGKIINRSPNRTELDFFTPFIFDEIKTISPQLAVTLGNVPLRILLGNENASIGNYHGKIICHDDMRIFPLYHPAAVIYNRNLEEVYRRDLDTLGKNL